MAGGTSKKAKGKHRLDKFYHLAKEQGYRSRAAFKLVQLNKKYDFLGKSHALLDLCAAPGGWLQVAHKYMPMSSVIVGIDLVPIKPIRGVTTLTEDITTEKCRSAIKKVLPANGLFDVVICDGAPNVGGAWSSEAYTQAALVLEACRLATDFLAPKGLFITKVFRSPEYHALLYTFHQLFDKVESTKPAASRATSAEIYVACSGYRAPGRLDRRLLDPAHVFAPVDGATAGPAGAPAGPVDGAGAPARDVIHGKEGHVRQRGGYDDSLRGVLWRAGDVEAAFMAAEKPAEALAAFGAFTVAPDSDLLTHPATTTDVLAALADLRVLAKREFRQLLRWRQTVLKSRALAAKEAAGEEEAAEAAVEPADEEAKLEGEMAELAARAAARQRREKKAAAKAKSKARVRAALGVASAGGPGGGEGAYGPDAELFALKHVTGKEALEAVAGGDADEDGEDGPAALAALIEGAPVGRRKRGMPGPDEDSDEEEESDADEMALERELDGMYEAYAARRGIPLKAGAQRRARARLGAPMELEADGAPPPKRGRKDDDWDLTGQALAARTAADAAAAAAAKNPLLVNLPGPARASRAVDAWFSQTAFEGLDAEMAAPAAPADTDDEGEPVPAKRKRAPAPADSDDDAEDIRTAARAAAAGWAAAGKGGRATRVDNGGEFTVVPAAAAAKQAAVSDDSDGSDSEDRRLDETLDDGVKAEIRAMGRLFLNRKSRDALIEGGYHKWVTGGGDDVPDWFAEDEARHCRPALPISAADAAAERAHLRALDARPIKKVAEAKARKKKRAFARLEAARSAANAIAEQEDTPLASRMRQIERVYAKSARGKGGKGAKEGGKFKSKTGATGKKMDPRMRKDKREVNAKAKKAAAKKSGKGGKGSKGGKGKK